MNHPENEFRLGRLLADWRPAPGRDPRFRARVWSRIEAESVAPSWAAYVRGRALWVAGALALAATVGAVTGSGRARARTEEDRKALAKAYVHALDPRWTDSR